MRVNPTVLSGFLGLNNVADPETGTVSGEGGAVSWQWQSQADNVDLSDAGRLRRRDGYRPFAAGSHITGSFATFDFSRLYVVDAGDLRQIHEDGSSSTLLSGLEGDVFWAEINGDVLLSGSQKWALQVDGSAAPWGVPVPMGGSLADTDGHLDAGEYQVCFTFTDERGREGGASASAALNVALGGILVTDIPAALGCVTNVYVADRGTVFYLAATLAQGTQAITINRPPAGRELVTQFLDAPPAAGRHVAEFGGRIYMAEYLAESNASAIWRSEPLGFHLFNLNEGFFMVPGEVTQMASARGGPLVICTQNRTHIYDGESMQTVEYGAVPGQHASRGPDGRLYFWTSRGLCRAAPFENLTESRVSVPPGLSAAGGIVQRHGITRYVAVLQSGGAAFNKR